jgi:hypothetical protein
LLASGLSEASDVWGLAGELGWFMVLLAFG